VVEVAVELSHWEIGFAADLADGFADASGILLIQSEVLAQKEADFAEEGLLGLYFGYSVAGLVKTGVAAVAVDHLVVVVALSAEAYFAVSFEQTFELLDFGASLLALLLLDSDLFPVEVLQGLLQHFFSFIAVASFEIEEHFCHA